MFGHFTTLCMKGSTHWTSTPLPSWYLLFQSQQWKYQSYAWKQLYVNNKDTRMTSMTSFYVILVSLFLTYSRFHTLFLCFYCWLWTSKFQLGAYFFYNPLLKVASNLIIPVTIIITKLPRNLDAYFTMLNSTTIKTFMKLLKFGVKVEINRQDRGAFKTKSNI